MHTPSHPHRVGKRLTPVLRHRCMWPMAMAVLLLMTTLPALATAQCPAEFGPKDPMVNVLGWCVVAVGILLGAVLPGLCITRSRTLRRPARAAIIALGLLGMLLVWVMGFALAFSAFFFTC